MRHNPFLIRVKSTVFCWAFLLASCNAVPKNTPASTIRLLNPTPSAIKVAANRTEAYLPLLEGKNIGVVANATSVIFKDKGYTHLVDSLSMLGIGVRKIFTPEHGFRGTADAGEAVEDSRDAKTRLPIISLYGKNKKPSQTQLQGLDIIVFDIQDVGVRFYTYIATLQLVMEACAEAQLPMVVLDRPNPNAHYIDGPVLETQNASFLGMTPIPLVYGMTIGEYAQMLNGEGWLADGLQTDLTVISLENYTHTAEYELPIRPSPNLPNTSAINLYPSLGLFEGTTVNAGRGTASQFQRYGASFLDSTLYDFSYVPEPNFGSKYPKESQKRCYGRDLSQMPKMNSVSLHWIIEAYRNSKDPATFFNTTSFTQHAGTATLQQYIIAGWTEEDIKKTWQSGLEAFQTIREKYLMY